MEKVNKTELLRYGYMRWVLNRFCFYCALACGRDGRWREEREAKS